VKADFLHPTTRGGQIRTLEILRRLHTRHEIHYAALDDGQFPEALARSAEYCTRAYPVPHSVPVKTSPAFAVQLAAGLYRSLPVAVSRFRSPLLDQTVRQILSAQPFDSLVCDFLFPAASISGLESAILFQHNVETLIWERRRECATNPMARAYLGLQARRMARFEAEVCRRAGFVIGVSDADVSLMRERFGVTLVGSIPTGVDIARFSPTASSPRVADLVFIGSMDWLPNIDGTLFFVREVLPLVRRSRPGCTVAIVGRAPTAAILDLARRDPAITVTGTVDDVRPYLWGSRVSIVPLRIGGGTRLKIYEAMAARSPVVSTTVGAEGLPLDNGRHILLADTAEAFADACVELLENPGHAQRLSSQAFDLVSSRFSWETVVTCFEDLLYAGPRPPKL
jgi:glycosyltransferase involved in cell wall biosynthesis